MTIFVVHLDCQCADTSLVWLKSKGTNGFLYQTTSPAGMLIRYHAVGLRGNQGLHRWWYVGVSEGTPPSRNERKLSMVDLNLNLMQAELNGAGKIRMSSLSPRGDLFKKGCIRLDKFF